MSKIAGIATREVDGVYDLGGNVQRAVGLLRERIPVGSTNLFPGRLRSRSAKAGRVDLTIIAEYGFAIADLAAGIRRNVIASVERMTACRSPRSTSPSATSTSRDDDAPATAAARELTKDDEPASRRGPVSGGLPVPTAPSDRAFAGPGAARARRTPGQLDPPPSPVSPDLHGGVFGEVANYLPGARSPGARGGRPRGDPRQRPHDDRAAPPRRPSAARLEPVAGRPVHETVDDVLLPSEIAREGRRLRPPSVPRAPPTEHPTPPTHPSPSPHSTKETSS